MRDAKHVLLAVGIAAACSGGSGPPPPPDPCEPTDGGSTTPCGGRCGPREYCDGVVCQACPAETLCTAAFSACTKQLNNCIPCRENTCLSSVPKCVDGGVCSECLADSDCPAAT